MRRFKTTTRIVDDTESSYTAEAELVQQRAERGEPSVIRRGQIVFFSTAAGDAWMLDANDGEAACLAREGRRDPIPIEEGADKFSVAWQGCYRFEQDLFIASGGTGAESVMLGYPVAEIKALISGPLAGAQPAAFEAFACRDRLRRTGRNDPCPCGSGRKYKQCCQPRDEIIARG